MTQANFMSWASSCAKCGKIWTAGHGLFCSNFLLGQATFPPCRNVWCGECYREASNDRFPRLEDQGKTTNATDLEIDASPTLGRYGCGRNGDHLMGVPFECSLCLFRNVCGRQPEFKNKGDQFTLTSIRRAQLDVMWAREPHTGETLPTYNGTQCRRRGHGSAMPMMRAANTRVRGWWEWTERSNMSLAVIPRENGLVGS